MVVWDGLNTHISRAMGELVAARAWLTVFRLPPYAHELNPVETAWALLKAAVPELAGIGSMRLRSGSSGRVVFGLLVAAERGPRGRAGRWRRTSSRTGRAVWL